ncbi:MAG: MFS transporter, partial [Gammaproteobacteria bacterium]|nr:MFS transporter [Gammaproteobacteria bacterium]
NMSTGEIGSWLALAVGVGGGTACLLGGFLTDYVANRTNDKRWYMWIPAITIMLSIPFVCGIYLAPTPRMAMIMAVCAFFFGNTWLGPTIATIQAVAPLRMRALAFAIMIFIHNIIGLGLGPQIVGILSDYLKEALGNDSLRYSLLSTLVLASLISVFHYLMAARTLRQDLEQNQILKTS